MKIKPCKFKTCYWFFENWEEEFNCVLSYDIKRDCLLNNYEHCLIKLRKLTRSFKFNSGEVYE